MANVRITKTSSKIGKILTHSYGRLLPSSRYIDFQTKTKQPVLFFSFSFCCLVVEGLAERKNGLSKSRTESRTHCRHFHCDSWSWRLTPRRLTVNVVISFSINNNVHFCQLRSSSVMYNFVTKLTAARYRAGCTFCKANVNIKLSLLISYLLLRDFALLQSPPAIYAVSSTHDVF